MVARWGFDQILRADWHGVECTQQQRIHWVDDIEDNTNKNTQNCQIKQQSRARKKGALNCKEKWY